MFCKFLCSKCVQVRFDLVYDVYCHFQQYFSYIVMVSFIGAGNCSTGENHQPVASH
jgi:hypothetical protein